MKTFGIDVSKWEGNFDFERAQREEGVQFAILKIGGADAGKYTDSKFLDNYKKCEACGLPKGAYYYGNAKNVEEAKKEAEHLISLLKGLRFEYPIFYDVEGKMLNADKRTLTDIIKTVCNELEKAGYWAGIYGSVDNLFLYHAYDEELVKYSHWGASWEKDKPSFKSGAELQMWQFGGETNQIRSNKINSQVVDQNYCYVDYPSKIKEKKLNGYAEEKPEQESGIAAGTKIQLTSDACDLNSGMRFASWVYSGTFDIIRVEGNRVVFGKGKSVTGVVDQKHIKGNTVVKPSIVAGASVKIKSEAKDLNSNKPFDAFVYNSTYTIIRVEGNRVVFGKGKSVTGVVSRDDIILS